MSEVSTALQTIRKGDGTDTQPILHLIELINSPPSSSHLLTLSPGCNEVFLWWDRGPGQHPQSAACFTFFASLLKSVLADHAQFHAQAVALGRKIVKERLHSVYSCLSKYSSSTARKHCLDFLILLNCFGGSVTKTLLDDFNFGNASLKQMLANSGPAHEDAVRFMLSFLCVPSVELKVRFMMMKNALKNMTSRINKDSVNLRLELTKVLLEHVLNIAKIQKKVLCQFFAVPVLVKMSQFWEDPATELQEQTDLFFRTLFHRKTGILFESSAVDIMTDKSRNPVLLNFVKYASSNSKYFGDFLVEMVKVCPEVSSSLISSILSKKSAGFSFVSDLCKVLQARDVNSLLSTVTSDVTDKQIIDYLVPKSVTELIEKQMKINSSDITVYPLLLVLTESAAVAVQTLPDRALLRDIAIYNLVDISVINSVGLLTAKLAGLLSKIDKFCLHQFKLEKLIEVSEENSLSGDDVELLIRTYPTALKRFVSSHQLPVVKKILEKSSQSRELFHQILLAISDDTRHSRAIAILESVVFDDHSGLSVSVKGVKRELALDDELLVLVSKICDISSNFGIDLLNVITEGLRSGQCNFVNVDMSKCEMISILIAYICNPKFEISEFEQISWNYDLEDKLLAADCPAYFLGAELLTRDDLWTDIRLNYFDEIRKDPIFIQKICLMAEHFIHTKAFVPIGFTFEFLTIFDDHLMIEMRDKPIGYEKIVGLLVRFIDLLLDKGAEFTDVEVMKCVVMKEWLTEKRVEAVFRNFLIDDFDQNDTMKYVIPTIRNHFEKFVEFCEPRFFGPYESGHCSLNFFRLFQTEPNALKIDEYLLVWFVQMFGKDEQLFVDLEVHIPSDVVYGLYSELCSRSCLKVLEKWLCPCHFSLSAVKHMRYQSILILENSLNFYGFEENIDFQFSVAEYQGHAKEYKDYCEKTEKSETYKRVCLLPNIIFRTVPDTEDEAAYLVCSAIKLGCSKFFISHHFRKTADLSKCLKSKKYLKEIFELFMKDGDMDNLRRFLSQHVSVYEEYLPAFTRKQFNRSATTTAELLNQGTEDEFVKHAEVLMQLLITFQEIIPGDRLSNLFVTFVSHPSVQKYLISEETSAAKTLLTKLLVLIIETGKVPAETLTTAQYLVFQTAYSATTSPTDKNILKILKHFQQQGVTSKYPFAYGAYATELRDITNITLYNEYCIKILENIDSTMLNNLIDNFPLHSEESTKMDTVSSNSVISCELEYILSLLHHVIQTGEVDVRMILSHPISRIMFLALSSYDEVTRRVAYVCLEKTALMVEEEKFKEKSMCSYLFKMIENSITSVEERLPHLSVYFIGKMLHALFMPHKQIYLNICHFLLQRPVYDFHDVPMFYSMFCSSTLHYKQDQNWLLEILCVAVRDEVDYKILARRHVLPHCYSQVSCLDIDKYSSRLIQRLFAKVFSIKSAKVQKDLAELGIPPIVELP